jgi:hypothetical protein
LLWQAVLPKPNDCETPTLDWRNHFEGNTFFETSFVRRNYVFWLTKKDRRKKRKKLLSTKPSTLFVNRLENKHYIDTIFREHNKFTRLLLGQIHFALSKHKRCNYTTHTHTHNQYKRNEYVEGSKQLGKLHKNMLKIQNQAKCIKGT